MLWLFVVVVVVLVLPWDRGWLTNCVGHRIWKEKYDPGKGKK